MRIGDGDGQVEKITLRTTVLRDFEGVVHIIRNGEMTRVSNLTKTWSRTVLVEWGELLLDRPEMLGIQQFADSAAIIRMQARTLPLKPWEIARALRRRIKHRISEEGIEQPCPHITLYWSDKQAPVLQ